MTGKRVAEVIAGSVAGALCLIGVFGVCIVRVWPADWLAAVGLVALFIASELFLAEPRLAGKGGK